MAVILMEEVTTTLKSIVTVILRFDADSSNCVPPFLSSAAAIVTPVSSKIRNVILFDKVYVNELD